MIKYLRYSEKQKHCLQKKSLFRLLYSMTYRVRTIEICCISSPVIEYSHNYYYPLDN